MYELPNVGSPHQTPASLATDAHYMSLRLVPRWDWDRFARLSAFLKLTPYELGSLALITHKEVGAWSQNNLLPMKEADARRAALILTLIEAHILKDYTSDIIENPFPKT